MRSRPEVKTLKTDRSDKLFDLPEIPKRAERLKILLKERPDPNRTRRKSGKVFVLVSGLPRSGTSLMMQMLAAGGMKILTDKERAADMDNPKGYYEWEPIKQIGKNLSCWMTKGWMALRLSASQCCCRKCRSNTTTKSSS